ncbi:MAG: RNA methyltransferase [Vicingaceae bacterium]|nr:RNA methyltransferase [Vicingaceae bacterium]
MITANQKKFVKSLAQKKFRTENNCFVVEGVKLVEELLQSDFEVMNVYATSNWIENNPSFEAEKISPKDLAIMSSFKTANEVIAVVKQKQQYTIDYTKHLSIVLDSLQDPGNLGTIIRTADWFGIKTIVCSADTVDVYNPKVIQATMGSLFRVNVLYLNLPEFFKENKSLSVYGALLNGENVYQKTLTKKGSVLLMGNESKGISDSLLPFITDKILIPKIGQAESLNVSTATAILCAEFSK